MSWSAKLHFQVLYSLIQADEVLPLKILFDSVLSADLRNGGQALCLTGSVCVYVLNSQLSWQAR